nr:hypothetical protein BaRGS_026897 [Batillaria attramentaria]
MESDMYSQEQGGNSSGTATVTSSLQDNDTILYPLVKQPAYMIAVLSIAYGCVFVLAVIGNFCVLAVVIRDKRFHSVTYIFISNLALADLLVAIFCNPITLMSNLFNAV